MTSVSHLSSQTTAGESTSHSVSEFFRCALPYVMGERPDPPSVDELTKFFHGLGANTGGLFFGAVESLISHFVRVDGPDHDRSGRLTDSICKAAMRHPENIAGWDVTYENVAGLRQAYWDAVDRQIRSKIERNRTHRVIRINDIPFAEAVFPALLSWQSNTLGYTILIEDIKWSEVGAALLNHRIDVAIYPSYAREHIKLVDTVFERRNVYRSKPLMRYKDYPIIRNLQPKEEGRGHLGVPARSDFIPVLKDSSHNGYIDVKLGNSRISKVPMSAVRHCSSADAVTAMVVNGDLEFGLVGGLQAEYVRTQYEKEIHPNRGDSIQICDNLNRKDDHGECFFWTAVNRRDEAETLLGAMVSLWNELVVEGWQDIVNGSVGEAAECEIAQRRLVGMVNAQSHRAFVSDFTQLKTLIQRHDYGLDEPVDRGVELVPF